MATAATTPRVVAAKSPAAKPDTKTIAVPLPLHVYDYFVRQAEAEDRTLNNLLKRKLVAIHDSETSDLDAGDDQ